MDDLNSLILLFLVIFPGAGAITLWDYALRRGKRSLHSLLGWGTFASLLVLLPFAACDLFRLDEILKSESPLATMLRPTNLATYLGFSLTCMVVAVGSQWILRRAAVQSAMTTVLGRTVGDCSWSELMSRTLSNCVQITTSDGATYQGCVFFIPEADSQPTALIGLKEPRILYDGEEDGLPIPGELYIRVIDIQSVVLIPDDMCELPKEPDHEQRQRPAAAVGQPDPRGPNWVQPPP